MASDTDTGKAERSPRPSRFRWLPGSRLGRLIIALNLLGLAILIGGALVLGELRRGLVGARIDSHIKRMRKKFRQVDPTFDAIETLYGVGYRYRET